MYCLSLCLCFSLILLLIHFSHIEMQLALLLLCHFRFVSFRKKINLFFSLFLCVIPWWTYCLKNEHGLSAIFYSNYFERNGIVVVDFFCSHLHCKQVKGETINPFNWTGKKGRRRVVFKILLFKGNWLLKFDKARIIYVVCVCVAKMQIIHRSVTKKKAISIDRIELLALILWKNTVMSRHNTQMYHENGVWIFRKTAGKQRINNNKKTLSRNAWITILKKNGQISIEFSRRFFCFFLYVRVSSLFDEREYFVSTKLQSIKLYVLKWRFWIG